MSEKQISIYHNPRCSKSRAALSMLEEKGIHPNVIDYLKTPPSKTELQLLLQKLNMKPEEIIRKGEEIYKTNYQGKHLSDDEWLDALIEHPILIERPIAVSDAHAIVGRPPEKVLELL